MNPLLVFARDDRGSETLETMAVIALVVMPITAFLLRSREKLYDILWFMFQKLQDSANQGPSAG